ncbi:hypothetical protein [Siphonobacter sp. BAB-5405]|uniref:hypothetical protein n=1 Tax=Siphonobacter sp. BAB-5405 TaxID=1864825 RepID=UPI001304A3C9|nr:hypothetical protein [Siphonobacter sp. BAB-5405]
MTSRKKGRNRLRSLPLKTDGRPITQQPSEFYIQTLEPTEVYVIPADFQNQL